MKKISLFLFLFMIIPLISAISISNGTTTYSSSSNSTLRFDNTFNLEQLVVDSQNTSLYNISISPSLKITNINSSYLGKLNIYNSNNTLFYIYNSTNFLTTSSSLIYSIISDYIIISQNPVFINSNSYSSLTYETNNENFTLNITFDNSIYTGISSATLFYNGNAYIGTSTISGNTAILKVNMDIPLGSGNKSFYWIIGFTNSSDEDFIQTNNYSQIVDSITFNICNATLNTSFITYNFYDETTAASVNGSIVSVVFDYYLGSGDVSKELIYSISPTNTTIPFCFSPTDKTLHLTYSMSYSGSGYQPRITNPPSSSYSSTNTNTSLYLLGTSDGIYVSFQVLNIANQPINEASVICSRFIGTTYTQIAKGTTGADGIVQFWLNPQYKHDCVFSATNYISQTSSIYPTQNQYTMKLQSSSSTSTNLNDYSKGITYQIYPINTNLLTNQSNYTFSFNIQSSIWTLQGFGFKLNNGTNNIYNGTLMLNGGQLNKTITGNYTQIVMTYYYIINGTYINGTKTFFFTNQLDQDWSLRVLFQDLLRFARQGMFGISFDLNGNSFALSLIVFIIIFVSVGIMSYKFGITSAGAISIFALGLVYMFDISLGIIPNVAGYHFVTIFMLLITITLVIREWMR